MQVKITITNSEEVMQERMEEFKQDPLRMIVATKFVNDLLERAKEEAIKRKSGERPTSMEQLTTEQAVPGQPRKQSRWHLRVRGYFLRIFATICLCNTTGKGST